MFGLPDEAFFDGTKVVHIVLEVYVWCSFIHDDECIIYESSVKSVVE